MEFPLKYQKQINLQILIAFARNSYKNRTLNLSIYENIYRKNILKGKKSNLYTIFMLKSSKKSS